MHKSDIELVKSRMIEDVKKRGFYVFQFGHIFRDANCKVPHEQCKTCFEKEYESEINENIDSELQSVQHVIWSMEMYEKYCEFEKYNFDTDECEDDCDEDYVKYYIRAMQEYLARKNDKARKEMLEMVEYFMVKKIIRACLW